MGLSIYTGIGPIHNTKPIPIMGSCGSVVRECDYRSEGPGFESPLAPLSSMALRLHRNVHYSQCYALLLVDSFYYMDV